MTSALDLAITFVAGFAIEACCVLWVHYAERGAPMRTALFAMIMAVAQIAGIGESIRDPVASAFFVLGYGAGTYAAVRYKGRLGEQRSAASP